MDLKVLALFAPRNFVTLNSMWMLVNACSVEGTMKKIRNLLEFHFLERELSTSLFCWDLSFLLL